MTVLELTGLIGAGSFVAGFLGSLTGLGGGVVIVPLLTLVFGIDIHYAVGASANRPCSRPSYLKVSREACRS